MRHDILLHVFLISYRAHEPAIKKGFHAINHSDSTTLYLSIIAAKLHLYPRSHQSKLSDDREKRGTRKNTRDKGNSTVVNNTNA